MDGIDAVVVKFADNNLKISAAISHPYPDDVKARLRLAIDAPESIDADGLGELDTQIGECFRDAALAVIEAAGMSAADIVAIGSHGQTVRHRPDADHRFTLQIGNPAIVASGTGITTVADFRRTDLALGGEGAPLMPPFHAFLFGHTQEARVVLNIGGIANLTVLPGGEAEVTGFDAGPGNTLLDAWVRDKRDQPFDRNGSWSAQGKVVDAVLDAMLADPWFAKVPPKSTGFEYFNTEWLERFDVAGLDPVDVQATLAELSATSIADAVTRWAPGSGAVFVCGGGAHNADLLARLRKRLPSITVNSTADAGVDPDWIEASGFAWLAMRNLEGLPGNLPSVTGASREAILGAVYQA